MDDLKKRVAQELKAMAVSLVKEKRKINVKNVSVILTDKPISNIVAVIEDLGKTGPMFSFSDVKKCVESIKNIQFDMTIPPWGHNYLEEDFKNGNPIALDMSVPKAKKVVKEICSSLTRDNYKKSTKRIEGEGINRTEAYADSYVKEATWTVQKKKDGHTVNITYKENVYIKFEVRENAGGEGNVLIVISIHKPR